MHYITASMCIIYLTCTINPCYSAYVSERKRKNPSKGYYSTRDIAVWSGRSIWTVRKDVRGGVLDPVDLWGMLAYVARHKPENFKRLLKEEGK